MESLLSLWSGDAELGKAVDGDAYAEEALQHSGEEKGAAAGELIFVELHLNARAAREAYALLGDEAREVRLTVNLCDALDDVLRVGGAAKDSPAENFKNISFSCFFPQKLTPVRTAADIKRIK